MSNKELTPAEAYQALIDGKVIEKTVAKYKIVKGRLGYLDLSGNWSSLGDDVSAEFLLNLTGYRLARKKVKKEVKCYANIYADDCYNIHKTKTIALSCAEDHAIATAVEMTGYYEVWEDG